MRQDQQIPIFKETQQTENIVAKLNTDFPKLRSRQFFEVLEWNGIEFLD